MKKILFTSLLLFNLLHAQEELYLIDTLVGKSATNRLHYAQSLGDINGDGYSDIIVQSDDSTRIYLGNPDFELKPDIVFKGYRNSHVNVDVNNDGYSDFLLGGKFYYGAENIDTSAGIPFSTPYYYRRVISREVGEIGDVNGDGYEDFVISSPYIILVTVLVLYGCI